VIGPDKVTDSEDCREKALAEEQAPSTSEPTSAVSSYRHCVLGDDLEIVYQSKAEVDFLYEDIFDKQTYLKYGICVKNGDCIFDVGANIGLFALFVHRNYSNVKVYAFEPAPPLFELLRANTLLHGVDVKLFNCGLSNKSTTEVFTYYPNSSAMSSFYANKNEEKEVLRTIILNQLRQGVEGMGAVIDHAEEILEERFKSQTFKCELRTVSDVINKSGIEVIDLMKIDVQKSELDVLEGINEEDWPKIRQIVVEVHDIDGRVEKIASLLRKQGYDVTVEQDENYKNSGLYNLYSVKRSSEIDLLNDHIGHSQFELASLKHIRDRAKRQGEVFNRKRQMTKQREDLK
jgi:FkbM family methyltransferase